MVKADVSRDYYADLDIPSTASEEEIKKAFRTLAKALHPDRNPGKEAEVVPKFQAVQAAHEILSDAEAKRKYDLDRAKFKSNAPTAPRRGPVPPPPSPFPPPPRRTAPTASRQDPFATSASNARPRQAQQPSNADKYAPYARAGAQQWDKNKEEGRSKADAFRGFQQMKPGQSPTGERFAPTPPPRPGRYTSAPRPTSYAPHSAGPVPNGTPRPRRSWEDFDQAGRSTAVPESSAGFPGLSRSQSTRRKQGFTPTEPGGDEPQAPRSSAYASYTRGQRPQASTAQSYFPEDATYPSPHLDPRRPSPSPLRHAKSSPIVEEDAQSERPGVERISTRYGGIGGEKTNIASGGLGRSSSARTSPVEPRWHERTRDGGFSSRSQERQRGAPSISPKSRPPLAHDDSTSSDSEMSSDDDEEDLPWATRSTAIPPPTRPPTRPPAPPGVSEYGGRKPSDGQTSTGHFPGTNYVKPLTAREIDSGRSQYQPMSQAAFNYVPGVSRARYMPSVGTSGVEERKTGPGAPVNGPNKYARSLPPVSRWIPPHACPAGSGLGRSVPSLNGFPLWAVPSSVLPFNVTTNKRTLDPVREEMPDAFDSSRPDVTVCTHLERPHKPRKFADTSCSYSSTSETNPTEPRRPPDFVGPKQGDVNQMFSASEWDGTFAAEEMFRPNVAPSQGKRSPVRATTPRTRSHSRTQTSPVKQWPTAQPSNNAAIPNETSENTETFAGAKFSSEQWADKLRFQAASSTNADDRAKSGQHGPQAPAPRRQPTYPKPTSSTEEGEEVASSASGSDLAGVGPKLNEDVDPMDVDEPTPRRTSSIRPEAKGAAVPASAKVTGDSGQAAERGQAGLQHDQPAEALSVNLDKLSTVHPFVPSNTGIGDLKDLQTNLPFESRASTEGAPTVVANRIPFASLKALKLPHPPRQVIPPLEGLDQTSWTRYTSEISAYMRDWHSFDQKMLTHFGAREAELSMTLMSNWTSALGDGPSGIDVTRKLQDGSQSSGGGGGVQKAGYAAYREWMEEDMRAREWWNVACERHRDAVRDLGRVREKAKAMNSE